MNDAKEDSPNKVIDRLYEGDLVLSIFKGPQLGLQRRFFFAGGRGYSNAIRPEDREAAVKLLIDEFDAWHKEHASNKLSEEPVGDAK